MRNKRNIKKWLYKHSEASYEYIIINSSRIRILYPKSLSEVVALWMSLMPHLQFWQSSKCWGARLFGDVDLLLLRSVIDLSSIFWGPLTLFGRLPWFTLLKKRLRRLLAWRKDLFGSTLVHHAGFQFGSGPKHFCSQHAYLFFKETIRFLLSEINLMKVSQHVVRRFLVIKDFLVQSLLHLLHLLVQRFKSDLILFLVQILEGRSRLEKRWASGGKTIHTFDSSSWRDGKVSRFLGLQLKKMVSLSCWAITGVLGIWCK